MDINMKEIKLVKPDGQNWVFISEDGTTPTTKLLLDDGSQSIEKIEENLRNLAVKNGWDTVDDISGTWDYMLTAGDALEMTVSSPLDVAGIN